MAGLGHTSSRKPLAAAPGPGPEEDGPGRPASLRRPREHPPPSERRVTGRCSAPALSQLHSNSSRARATAARPPRAARAAPRRRPFPGPDGPRPRRPDGPRGCRGRGAQAAACPRGGSPSVGGAAGVGAGARGAAPPRTASGLPSAPRATPLPNLGSTGSRALSPHFVRNLTRHPPLSSASLAPSYFILLNSPFCSGSHGGLHLLRLTQGVAVD